MSKYFKPEEFECKCGKCTSKMDMDFVDLLDRLRYDCGFPLVVSSGYRCPEYNAKVSSTGVNGPHTTGLAVDLRVSGNQARIVVGRALQLGFLGIGVSQKGEHGSRFIHLDMVEEGTRPWLWSY